MDERPGAEEQRETESVAHRASRSGRESRLQAAWTLWKENPPLGVMAVAGLVVIVVALWSPTVTKPPASGTSRTAASYSQPPGARSPGYRLAVIDGLSVSSETDAVVARYNAMLARLAGRCANEDARGVADIAVVGARLLRERGVDANAWTVLAGLDAGTAGGGGFDCDRIAAAFVTITASFAGP